MSKDFARQAVKRARQGLAEAYRDLHGRKPNRPLLIETKPGMGYRLDPLTRIVTRDQIS